MFLQDSGMVSDTVCLHSRAKGNHGLAQFN